MAKPRRLRRYRLEPADALAYESLPRELAGWRLIAFMAWMASAGGVLAALPEGLVGSPWEWRLIAAGAAFVAIFWLASLALRQLLARIRAHRRLPRAVMAELAEFNDCLRETIDGVTREMTATEIGVVHVLPDLIVVESRRHAILVPASAFDDADDKGAFAARWNDIADYAAP